MASRRMMPMPVPPVVKEEFEITKVRQLIASYLGVAVETITDEAHFDDFGADWLDRLELMMAIEDSVVGAEIMDDDVDKIGTVGDLIRLAESAAQSTRMRSGAR
jgi:acyl carrier protein